MADPDLKLKEGGGGWERGRDYFAFLAGLSSFCDYYFFFPKIRGQAKGHPAPSPGSAAGLWTVVQMD